MTIRVATANASLNPEARHSVESAQIRESFLRALATVDPDVKSRILGQIVSRNLRVADRLAKRYAGRGIATDDLTQVARLGLVQAVRRFNPSNGDDFLGFAVPTILGELKRHFRDCGWVVRPPRRIQELRPAIASAVSSLTPELQRLPTRAEIAEHLGEDIASIEDALAADGCFSPASLDRSSSGHQGVSSIWVDALGDFDQDLEATELRVTLAGIFRNLSARDRRVLRLRLVEDMTQKQIGVEVGVTQMQVSRILARIRHLVQVELTGWTDVGYQPS